MEINIDSPHLNEAINLLNNSKKSSETDSKETKKRKSGAPSCDKEKKNSKTKKISNSNEKEKGEKTPKEVSNSQKETISTKDNELISEKEKKSQKSKNTDESYQTMILEYMKAQNRPYSAQNIFDNLHAEIPRAVLQRIVDQLSTENKLLCKEYGKAKVYLYEQSQLGEPMSEDDIKTLEDQIKGLEIKIKEQENTLKTLKAEVRDVERLKHRKIQIGEYEKKLEEREAFLNTIESKLGTQPVEQSQIKDKKQQYQRDLDQWKIRKKICYNLVSAVSQMTETKIQDVIEELGIDRDEDFLSIENIV